jgi:hypothetical protein
MIAQRDYVTELKPNPDKWMGALAFFLISAVIGVFLVRNGEWWKGGGLVVWGVSGFGVSLAAVFSKRMTLRLTPQGFAYGSLRKKYFFKWGDVSGFGIGKVNEMKTCFNMRSDYQGEEKVRGINRRWIGYDRFLPDTYGKDPMELAKLMEEWRFLYSQSSNAQN